MQATGGAEREPANGQKRRWQPRAEACMAYLLGPAPLYAEAGTAKANEARDEPTRGKPKTPDLMAHRKSCRMPAPNVELSGRQRYDARPWLAKM
jgi:hypothetical protein